MWGTAGIWVPLCLTLLAGCAPIPPAASIPQADFEESRTANLAAYQEAIDLSGESEAGLALAERLRAACRLPDLSPSSIPELRNSGLMPPMGEFQNWDTIPIMSGETCIRSQVVAAFEAAEGEHFCQRADNLGYFVSCIITGAYKTQIARNLGIKTLTAEAIWGDTDQATQKINETLFRTALDKCRRRSQWEANNCAENFLLPALEVDRSDISNCPSGKTRGVCLSKTGLARFINHKLIYIF